jgi:hypothetical protein
VPGAQGGGRGGPMNGVRAPRGRRLCTY